MMNSKDVFIEKSKKRKIIKFDERIDVKIWFTPEDISKNYGKF